MPSSFFESNAPAESELVPDHEVRVRCIEHGGTVIVGGFIDDIDHDHYVCLECRMRESGLTQDDGGALTPPSS